MVTSPHTFYYLVLSITFLLFWWLHIFINYNIATLTAAVYHDHVGMIDTSTNCYQSLHPSLKCMFLHILLLLLANKGQLFEYSNVANS